MVSSPPRILDGLRALETPDSHFVIRDALVARRNYLLSEASLPADLNTKSPPKHTSVTRKPSYATHKLGRAPHYFADRMTYSGIHWLALAWPMSKSSSLVCSQGLVPIAQ